MLHFPILLVTLAIEGIEKVERDVIRPLTFSLLGFLSFYIYPNPKSCFTLFMFFMFPLFFTMPLLNYKWMSELLVRRQHCDSIA